MPYSMITMREALKQLGLTSDHNAFVWEAKKGAVNPHLSKQFEGLGGRGKNMLNDMLEYCWLAYSKSLSASGPLLIGRRGDLWVTDHLKRAGITNKDKETLWDPHTKGNIQLLDKWAPVVNDCWVLGGVHRSADFELVSMRTLQNLWDFKEGYHVVTAREILGLLHFGYSLKQHPAVVKLVCTDRGKAHGSNLLDYAALMKGKEAAGPDSIRSILVMDPALQNQIQTFDKSRLKHVVPPR
jgi:hypothetical protein